MLFHSSTLKCEEVHDFFFLGITDYQSLFIINSIIMNNYINIIIILIYNQYDFNIIILIIMIKFSSALKLNLLLNS